MAIIASPHPRRHWLYGLARHHVDWDLPLGRPLRDAPDGGDQSGCSDGIVRGDQQCEPLARSCEHDGGPPCLSPACDATVATKTDHPCRGYRARTTLAGGLNSHGVGVQTLEPTLADTDLLMLMPLSLRNSRALRTLRRGPLPGLQTSPISSSSSTSNSQSTSTATSRSSNSNTARAEVVANSMGNGGATVPAVTVVVDASMGEMGEVWWTCR